jgi:hypothetical protein
LVYAGFCACTALRNADYEVKCRLQMVSPALCQAGTTTSCLTRFLAYSLLCKASALNNVDDVFGMLFAVCIASALNNVDDVFGMLFAGSIAPALKN